jgi:hypothetical protein
MMERRDLMPSQSDLRVHLALRQMQLGGEI